MHGRRAFPKVYRSSRARWHELTDFYGPRDAIDILDLDERQQRRGREEKETPARLHSAKLPARSTEMHINYICFGCTRGNIALLVSVN